MANMDEVILNSMCEKEEEKGVEKEEGVLDKLNDEFERIKRNLNKLNEQHAKIQGFVEKQREIFTKK